MFRLLPIFIFTISLWSSSLNSLINYSLKHSTIIKQTRLDIQIAKIKAKNAKLVQYGDLDLVSSYTHYNTERTLAPLSPSALSTKQPIVTTNNIFSVGVTYNVPLFTGYKLTRSIEIANIAKDMAYVKTKLTKEQLIYNIRSLYLSILAQKEILNAQYNYTKALKKLIKEIAYEVELGNKSDIDLLKTKSDLQNSMTSAEMLKQNIEITKASLSAFVGKKVTHIRPIKIRVKRPRYSINRLAHKSKSLAKIRIEDLSLIKANKNISKARSKKLPQVNLNSYVGKNYGTDIKTNNLENADLWQVGVNLKWNIVDFGKNSLSEQEAKVAKMKSIFKRKQALLDIKRDISIAVSKIKQNYSQYLGNRSQYKLSKKSAKIEKVRYQNDASTLNDLLLAIAKKELAYAKTIESKYNYKKSIYYLDYIMEKGAK